MEACQLSDNEEIISTYKQQGSSERGFRFLKDPLFLASSVFVKKPERIVALGFIIVLCLLIVTPAGITSFVLHLLPFHQKEAPQDPRLRDRPAACPMVLFYLRRKH